MRKIFLILLLGMFFISLGSSAEFDNVKSYNEELKVVTITNAFGMGEVIGQARLLSGQNVKLSAGYQNVSIFEIWAYDDYNDAIKQITLTDMKKKEKINRDFDLKKLTWEDVEVEDFYNDCPKDKNGWDVIGEVCKKIITDSHIENREVWTKITPADLKKSESIIVGVFTEVKVGDYVDWIPTIYGVEIEEWATWTQSLSVDNLFYEKLDETSGSVMIDSTQKYNGTNINSLLIDQPGKIGRSVTFDGTNKNIEITNDSMQDQILGGTDRSFSMWFYPTTSGQQSLFSYGTYGTNSANFALGTMVTTRYLDISGFGNDFVTALAPKLNEWNYISVTYGSDEAIVYLGYENGTLLSESKSSYTLNTVKSTNFFIGKYTISTWLYLTGGIDEFSAWKRVLTPAEQIQNFNGGTGITWTDIFGTAPNVTLNSPVDSFNTSSPTITFNTTVADANLTNVTLYLNGVANETNTSGVNGNYAFIKSVPQGVGNWSVLACNNESLCNQSETRTYNFTASPPTVILIDPTNDSTITTPTYNFTANVTDSIYVENVTLKFDGQVDIIITSHINGTYIMPRNISKFLSEGYHNWSVLACNSLSLCAESEVWFFNFTPSKPQITLTSPINNSNLTTPQVNFQFDAIDDGGIVNVTLYLDGVANITNTSGINGSYSIPIIVAEGYHNWSVSAYDDDGFFNQSQTWFFNYTQPPLFITLQNPIDNYNSSSNTVNISCYSYSDDGVTQLNLTVGGSLEETVVNTTEIQNLTLNKDVIFSDGTYEWSCEALNQITSTSSPSRTLTIDTIDPMINILYPTATTYTFNISTLNYTLTETNPDKCWYSTNGGTTNSSGVITGNFTGVPSKEGFNTWTVFCNDTLGHVGKDSVTFNRDTLNVILNSPADISTTTIGSVLFNATGFSSIGSTLSNISLWTNETGIFEVRNITTTTSGGNNYNETHGIQITTGGSISGKTGMIIQTDMTRNVSFVIKASYVTATTAYIQTGYASGILGSASFIGDVATFSPAITLTGSTNYYILVDGGTYSQGFNSTTLPIDSGKINWKNSVNQIGDLDTAFIRNIINIGNIQSNNLSKPQTWNRYIDNVLLWNVQVCQSDGYCSFANSNFTLGIDTVPPIAEIETPTGTLGSGKVGGPETLNVTFTDDNLEFCWYNYNGTNITIEGCLSGIKNSTTFILEEDNLNMTVYANDTSGILTSNFTEWEYNIIEISQTYENETIEGSTQDISALINLESGITVSAALINYNGTLSAGTSSASGENTFLLRSGLITPSVEADENVTFHWSLILSNGEIVNLTQKTQTILEIGVDNCSTFTNKILSLEIVDEKEQTLISSNTSLEIALNIFSEDRSTEVVDFSDQFEDINPVEICLNLNISGNVEYSVDSIIRYTAEGYSNEYYNIVDYTLTNESGTQEITLYSLNISDSTEFQLTFTGEDFLPVENALVLVGRQYISENTFKTVELPKTDSNGQTILHLVRNDVIYNILIMKDGVILGNFQNVIAFCEDFTIGACSLPLNAISNTSLVFDYDEVLGIVFEKEPQFNETTRITSFSFSSTDGTTKLVEMRVERKDVFGNRTICENSVLSASGELSCQISQDIDDTTLETIVSVNGEDKVFGSIDLDSTAYGQNGYAMFFIFAIAVLLMFSGSKTWTLIGVSINYIIGVSLGVIIGGIAGVGSTGIFVLIISVVGIWQLNKERKQ